MLKSERADLLARMEISEDPIPASYVRLKKIQDVFFWVSLAVLAISYWLFRLDNHNITLELGGLGLFLLALACQMILDLWYWWITRHLAMSVYEKVRRLRLSVLYAGGVGFAAALLVNKTAPPTWLVGPSLILIGIGFILHFIVVFWSHSG
jgi:hypothetical protein